MTYSGNSRNNRYRPDIDGLRAVAVALVVLCHAGFAVVSGGFVGVDIFFVISGFVVTASITKALEAGKFSFADFYIRRAKRLVPALYIVMASVFVFSVLFLIPDDTLDVAKNIAYVTILVSNIYLSKQTGYFDPKAEQQPLLHTWSLSVEEQFYLLLPLTLFLLRKQPIKRRLAVLGTLLVVSLAISQWATAKAAPGAYYLFQYRAFEFLIGVLLSLVVAERAVTGKRLDWLFLVGLSAILASAVAFDGMTAFPGLWALAPCAGAALVIFSGNRSRMASLMLSNRWTVALGKISYSLYLWHWPVFFALRRFGLHSTGSSVTGIVVSVALAAATYRWAEQPLRYIAMPNRRAVRWFIALPVVLVGSLISIGKLSDNFLFLYPSNFQTIYAQARHGTWGDERGKECWYQVKITDSATCSLGDKNAEQKAVLWGDSHAYQLIYFVDSLGKDYGLSVHDLAFPMCPPIAKTPAEAGDRSLAQIHRECVAHNRNVFDYLVKTPSIKTVFMSAVWENYSNTADPATAKPSNHGFMPGEINARLDETVGALLTAGKRVILFDDIPSKPHELINCQLYNTLYMPVVKRQCQFPREKALGDRAEAKRILDQIVAKYPSVKVIHTYGVSCEGGMCRLDFNGTPIYQLNDYGHLSLFGSKMYYDKYRLKHPTELNDIFGKLTLHTMRAPPLGARQSAPASVIGG